MTLIRTAPSRALLAGLLLLPACGGSSSEPVAVAQEAVVAAGPADAQTATVVSNDRLEFDPGVVEAKVGTLTLTHRNGGQVPHDLVFTDDSLEGIPLVVGGEEKSVTLTFDEPGTYDFFCSLHSGQDGELRIS